MTPKTETEKQEAIIAAKVRTTSFSSASAKAALAARWAKTVRKPKRHKVGCCQFVRPGQEHGWHTGLCGKPVVEYDILNGTGYCKEHRSKGTPADQMVPGVPYRIL